MPAKNHPFAAKSPSEKAAAIRPADAWPATAVGWRATDGKLLLTVTHHEANAPVEAFASDDNMLGSLCLLWAVATGSLPALDAATLVQRDPNHQWSTYQSAMHDLVTFLAAAPADAPQGLQQRAAAHVAPYGDFLRAVSPNAFLQLLAWDDDLKRPLHRVPLLENDHLATVAVKRAFAYRVLEWQPPPALDIPMECHFCAFTHPQLARHVRSRCMPAYQRLLWAQAIVVQSVPTAQGMYVSPDGTLYSPPGRPLLRCMWDGLYQDSTFCATPSPCLASGTPPVARTAPCYSPFCAAPSSVASSKPWPPRYPTCRPSWTSGLP